MPLVAILGLYTVLAFPSGMGVPVAQPYASAQEAQPQQDASHAAPTQEPAKSEPSTAQPAQSEPAQPEPAQAEPPKADQERKSDSSVPQSTEPAPAVQQPQAQEPQAQQPDSVPPDAAAKKPDTPATSSTGTKSKKSSRKHKPVTTTPASEPPKVVVKNGSTTDPVVQISPGLSKQQASNQRQKTDSLLTATDANLKKISGRQLNPGQQDTVNQVRKYVEQAKAAVDAGDFQRAHNLAYKAQLLSSELTKQ